ncbi:MAG: ATP synthase subunit I [Pseudomonadota bacterium]
MLVRLEMDAGRMSFLTFDSLPTWAMLLDLAAHLAAGIGLGALYFRGLWWNARRFARAGHLPSSIALMIGRIALLGGVLVVASLEGALPLLLTALGVLIARPAVMRRVQAASP